MGGLGGRTSGSEQGKKRRGLHGRSAKDIAAFGTVHFECIKDNEYNHLIIPPSLNCEFVGDKSIEAANETRKKLGIPKANGTVVTLEVNKRFNIPQHGKIVEEPAFLDNSARFIVYGHTHHHEIVPLDSDGEPPLEQDQLYIKGGGRCKLQKNGVPNVWIGTFRVEGRQLKAKGTICAKIQGIGSAEARMAVEDREPKSGILLKPPKPVEDDFRPLRYKWDTPNNPLQLLVGARHPSIRRYLGEPHGSEYPGINNPLYHTVLAEVIAEALAFKILEKEFARKGREGGLLDFTTTELYFHRHFTDFLAIAHKCLVVDTETTK